MILVLTTSAWKISMLRKPLLDSLWWHITLWHYSNTKCSIQIWCFLFKILLLCIRILDYIEHANIKTLKISLPQKDELGWMVCLKMWNNPNCHSNIPDNFELNYTQKKLKITIYSCKIISYALTENWPTIWKNFWPTC